MDPVKQMGYAFSKGGNAAKTSEPDSKVMGAALEGDGQHPGDADYSDYGQGGKTNDATAGETLYIFNSSKNEYYKYPSKPTEDEKKQQKYRYDKDTDSYVAINESYSSETFDSTADGESGRSSFSAAEVTVEETGKDGKTVVRTLSDAVSATVANGTTIDATGDITVSAGDVIDALIISGTAAASGAAGVGVGVTVAVLHSNVVAKVADGVTLSAGGNITVEAKSGSLPCRSYGSLYENSLSLSFIQKV